MRRLIQLVLPLLALAGLAVGSYAVLRSSHQAPAATPLTEPASAPFASYLGGLGQVEPPGRMVAIGAQVGGVAADVPVRAGDRVEAGAVLGGNPELGHWPTLCVDHWRPRSDQIDLVAYQPDRRRSLILDG